MGFKTNLQKTQNSIYEFYQNNLINNNEKTITLNSNIDITQQNFLEIIAEFIKNITTITVNIKNIIEEWYVNSKNIEKEILNLNTQFHEMLNKNTEESDKLIIVLDDKKESLETELTSKKDIIYYFSNLQKYLNNFNNDFKNIENLFNKNKDNISKISTQSTENNNPDMKNLMDLQQKINLQLEFLKEHIHLDKFYNLKRNKYVYFNHESNITNNDHISSLEKITSNKKINFNSVLLHILLVS